jgi:hypothetical protein
VRFIAACQGLIAISMLLKDGYIKPGWLAVSYFCCPFCRLVLDQVFHVRLLWQPQLFVLLKKNDHDFIWSPVKLITAKQMINEQTYTN